MTDAETLRAAAEIMRKRRAGWPATRMTLDKLADEIEAENAAKLQAAERDQRLGRVADAAYDATLGVNMMQWERWVAVARAVREAIEAEQ